MTDAQHTHTKAEIKKAWTLVNDYVARHSSGASADDRKDIAAVAIENWRAAKGTELECARRAISAHFRMKTRQKRIRRDRADDVRNGSHGGRSNYEDERVRFYAKSEESELRAAVLKHCRASYQKSWGKSWDPKKAGRVRELCRTGDTLHVKAEAEAREHLQDLSTVLRRSIVWSERTLSSGRDAYGPKCGGPLTAALCAALETMKELDSQLPAPKTKGFSTGPMLDEELRRFVWRARWNAAVSVALGCVRKPAGREPEPNGAWGVKPTTDEITVIWLLSGGWPKISTWKDGISVKALINRKMRPTIAEAVKDIDGVAK